MEDVQIHQADHRLGYAEKEKNSSFNLMSDKTDTVANRRQQLTVLLEQQPQASDFMWSLFRAASDSYKFFSLLRPFPKSFVDSNSEKNIEQLVGKSYTPKTECWYLKITDIFTESQRNVAASIPSVIEMLHRLKENEANSEQIELMHSILIQSKTFVLQSVKRTEFQKILKLVHPLSNISFCPQYIFEVDYSQRASNVKFESLIKKHGALYGFHGSRVENFYSILHHGLQVSLNKVAVFGPGVYLAGDIHVSMTFSPTGLAWVDSMFGEKLSVIALCQMIDHPHVKCQDEKVVSRKYADRNSEVPNKYFIVQNSDLVKVTHLLVYSQPNRYRGNMTWMPYIKIAAIAIIIYLIMYVLFKINT